MSDDELEPMYVRQGRVMQQGTHRRCEVTANHVGASLGIMEYLLEDLVAIEDFTTLTSIRARMEDLVSDVLASLDGLNSEEIAES